MQSGGGGVWRALARVHDGLTEASRHAGAFALAVIVFAYCFEVMSRYIFNAPTTWASELVSYAFCISVFLLLPHLTQTRGHVAVTIVMGKTDPDAAAHAQQSQIIVPVDTPGFRVERMLTVVATCRQQGRKMLEYLTSCFEAVRRGRLISSLPQLTEPAIKAT